MSSSKATSTAASSADQDLSPLTRSTSKTPVAVDYFGGREELSRRLSRTQTNSSIHTQDPTSDSFDYKQHLRYALRAGEADGVLQREIGVSFQGLNAIGLGAGVSYGPSMGEIGMAPLRLAETRRAKKNPIRKVILNNVTGSVRPGEMLLVLGRPGSGCSTMLKVLSNNIESFDAVEGDISYDGVSPKEMKMSKAGDVTYLPEDDQHLPNLTVGDTLNFAAAARTPASKGRVGTRADAVADTKEVLVTLFGLRHTLNTKVGNDIVRGVSGGERKRVSIAEALSSGCRILCHDNSTRGLDASTALEYARALRIATDIKHLTTIVSIYQASEQIFTVFDKVCVLYEGEMVYFGPMESAVEYFVNLGFEPQNRQTSADFLVAVTDPTGRFPRNGYEDRVPRTAAEFAAAWTKSKLGQNNLAAVQVEKASYSESKLNQYRESAAAEHVKGSPKAGPYLLSYGMQLKLAMRRRFQMQMGELPTLAIVTIAAIFQSLIIGSVYFQMTKTTAGFFSRGGVIFFAILYNSFTGLAEITTAYTARPVIVRQRQFAMIRPSADILAQNIVDMPFKLVSVFFFDLVIYFLSGLQVSAGQFFIFVLFTYVTNLAMLALFRALASANRYESNATTVGGILILVVAIYSGFAIPRPSMRPWFGWLSYAQPVSFAFESLMANEFRTLNVPCVSLVPSGPLYPNIQLANQVCAVLGSVPGDSIVNGLAFLEASFGYRYANVWRNMGIIIGYLIFFLIINVVTAERQRDESATGAIMIFKRGASPVLDEVISGGTDEEKASSSGNKFAELKSALSAQNHAIEKIVPSTDIFTWRNVCYDVQIKGTTRRLLSDVSGYVVPGRMTALMGESGAGKTTLLNVLAQRTDVGVVSGHMLVNGVALPSSFQRSTGYCQQQDTHMATSTVREALIFSAVLRQPASVSRADKLAYVEEVIHLLEMDAYAEALVGEVGMGLNVEQRKRLTIGVELAAKPALLIFLDEPTSGLDSQSSWSIMQLLRKLSDHGQAILATIHQPSSELFQVFDRLLLLKKGGETVYFGELGKNSTTMIEYFHARTDLRCGEKDNPAEYVLEAIGAGASSKATLDWHQLWKSSPNFAEVQNQINSYHAQSANKSLDIVDADSKLAFSSSFSVQFKTLVVRTFQNYWRSPTYLMAKLMLNIVAGLFIGFSFWDSPNNLAGLQNKLFAVFMAVVLAAPLSQQLQPKFIGLRTLYQARERPSAMYSWPVYVLSSILVEMPFNLVTGTIFFNCWYWTVNFPRETPRAGYAYLMYMLFELYFATFAQFVAALAPNAMAASILFSTFFSFVIIFNGVVVPTAQLPPFWRSWMHNLTPFTYLIEGLTANALGGVTITCDAGEFNFLTPPSGQECLAFLEPFTSSVAGYAQVIGDRCGYCAFRTGDQFLTTLTMSYSNLYRDVGIMCAYIVFNIALVFLFTSIFTIVDWGAVFKKKSTPVESETSSYEEKKL